MWKNTSDWKICNSNNDFVLYFNSTFTYQEQGNIIAYNKAYCFQHPFVYLAAFTHILLMIVGRWSFIGGFSQRSCHIEEGVRVVWGVCSQRLIRPPSHPHFYCQRWVRVPVLKAEAYVGDLGHSQDFCFLPVPMEQSTMCWWFGPGVSLWLGLMRTS